MFTVTISMNYSDVVYKPMLNLNLSVLEDRLEFAKQFNVFVFQHIYL